MRFDHFLIGLLVFSIFIIGGTFIWGDISRNYDVNTTNDSGGSFSEVYNLTDEMYDLSVDFKNETLAAEIEGGDQSWESLIKGGYSALGLIPTSFKLVGNILNAISKELGIPRFFVDGAVIALIISIVFSVIYMLFRFIPR